MLVGEPGERHTLLSSPIILEDHPRIAPESPGDLFDGGEIDQLLILNILSLTEEEKDEVRASDPRAREVLDRSEALSPEELMRLHGRTVRGIAGAPMSWDGLEGRAPRTIEVDGVHVGRGSLVRLHPGARGDVFDLALAGKAAVVESIQQDIEGGVSLAVVLEEDPGRDLGVARQPGHRFFFGAGEVEPLGPSVDPGARTVLIAGIGNVFLGDDGFGVEVARRLAERELPAGVKVADFGIRGMDLAYELQEDYDAAVLVDAVPRGGEPGTLYVIEPELEAAGPVLDAHAMDPVRVLGLARTLGTLPPRVLVVGCEPATALRPERRRARDGAQRARRGGDRASGRARRGGPRGPADHPGTEGRGMTKRSHRGHRAGGGRRRRPQEPGAGGPALPQGPQDVRSRHPCTAPR